MAGRDPPLKRPKIGRYKVQAAGCRLQAGIKCRPVKFFRIFARFDDHTMVISRSKHDVTRWSEVR